MNDLDLRIDPVAEPEGGAALARRVGTARLRRRWVVASGTVAVVAVLLVMLALPGRDQAERISTDPATTAPAGPVIGPALLDLPAEALAAQPAIPDGWKPIDFGLARVWVPNDLEVLAGPRGSRRCIDGGSQSVVLAPAGADCYGSSPMPRVEIGLTIACDDCVSVQSTTNGLITRRLPSLYCNGCDSQVAVPQLHVNISGNIPQLDQIVATVTPSAVARVLVDGPLAPVADWQPIGVELPGTTTGTTNPATTGPLTMWVPASWSTRALGEADQNPGACLGPRFSGQPAVVLGSGGVRPPCAPPVDLIRSVGTSDGVWLPGTNGVDDVAAVLSGPSTDFQVGPDQDAVELNLFTAYGSVRVVVGIGPDPAVARTILRTLSFG